MAVLFGALAALFIGAADIFASRASKLISPATVTRTMMLVSGMVALPLALAVGSAWNADDLGIGAASGAMMASGLVVLYRGYSTAPIGIVAPTSSVLLALVPVAIDTGRGIWPRPLGIAGMVLGLCGIALATYERGTGGKLSDGVRLGVISGVIFGFAFALMGEVSDESKLAPAVSQRFGGVAILLLYGLTQRRADPQLFATKRPSVGLAAMTGIVSTFGICFALWGYSRGSAGSVSVAVSQFATVAVVLSVVFNKERLRTSQAVGIAAAAVGVALLSAG